MTTDLFGNPIRESRPATGKQQGFTFTKSLSGDVPTPSGWLGADGRIRLNQDKEAEKRLELESKQYGQQLIG